MIFFITSLIVIVSALHAMVMRAVEGYDYGSSPTSEWRKFEAEKIGSHHIF